MVNRRPRGRAGVELSLDSLIDVFMNVLGVLMITAVVIALSARDPGSSASPSETSPPEPVPDLPAAAPPAPVARPEPIRLQLPQVQASITEPLYVLLTSEGLRPVNGTGLEELERYFNLQNIGSSLQLVPRPGEVMGRGEFQQWLKGHDPIDRHITALVRPDGVEFYRDVRAISADAGFRSGWLDHQGDTIVLGRGGRSGSDVQ